LGFRNSWLSLSKISALVSCLKPIGAFASAAIGYYGGGIAQFFKLLLTISAFSFALLVILESIVLEYLLFKSEKFEILIKSTAPDSQIDFKEYSSSS